MKDNFKKAKSKSDCLPYRMQGQAIPWVDTLGDPKRFGYLLGLPMGKSQTFLSKVVVHESYFVDHFYFLT